jgi:carbon storage regulator CsrA
MKKIYGQNGETVTLANDKERIIVTILDIENNRIKIGINTPKYFEIYREEIYKKKQVEMAQIQWSYYYHAQESEQQKKSPQLSVNTSHAKSKILLVEDVQLIRIVSCTHLKTLGCVVDAAKDGRETFDLLKNSQNKYDLILLDIGLPDISGIEICKWIRKNKSDSHVPIVFLTSHGESWREKCRKAGANDFVTKPLSVEKLQELVMRWLSEKK